MLKQQFQTLLKNRSVHVGLTMVLVLVLSLSFYLSDDKRKVKRTFFFPAFGVTGSSRRGGSPPRNLSDLEGKPVNLELTTELADIPDAYKLYWETRMLPIGRSLRESIRLLVEDIILGPLNPEHLRLLAGEVKVRSLLINNGVLYLSFSHEILKQDPSLLLPLEHQIQAAGNTLLFNFPQLKKVYIFVSGQIPDFSSFYGEELFNFSSGVDYNNNFLK